MAARADNFVCLFIFFKQQLVICLKHQNCQAETTFTYHKRTVCVWLTPARCLRLECLQNGGWQVRLQTEHAKQTLVQKYQLTAANDAMESYERARGLLNPSELIVSSKRNRQTGINGTPKVLCSGQRAKIWKSRLLRRRREGEKGGCETGEAYEGKYRWEGRKK